MSPSHSTSLSYQTSLDPLKNRMPQGSLKAPSSNHKEQIGAGKAHEGDIPNLPSFSTHTWEFPDPLLPMVRILGWSWSDLYWKRLLTVNNSRERVNKQKRKSLAQRESAGFYVGGGRDTLAREGKYEICVCVWREDRDEGSSKFRYILGLESLHDILLETTLLRLSNALLLFSFIKNIVPLTWHLGCGPRALGFNGVVIETVRWVVLLKMGHWLNLIFSDKDKRLSSKWRPH